MNINRRGFLKLFGAAAGAVASTGAAAKLVDFKPPAAVADLATIGESPLQLVGLESVESQFGQIISVQITHHRGVTYHRVIGRFDPIPSFGQRDIEMVIVAEMSPQILDQIVGDYIHIEKPITPHMVQIPEAFGIWIVTSHVFESHAGHTPRVTIHLRKLYDPQYN